MGNDNTNAARQQAFRERRQRESMVEVRVWVHREDAEAVRAKVASLKRSRARVR